MAELLEVPILRKGIYKDFPIDDLQAVAADTGKALPLLMEGFQSGTYRGNRDALNTEPIPGFINLNHDAVAPEKMRGWAESVSMELDTRTIDGEEWLVGNFRNVNQELAQLLSVGFPGRSVEILPNFENPDTGETYPVVIRSVAFLDRNTEPAVPQYPGYSVKMSKDADGVQVVSCEMPTTNNQPNEVTPMSDTTQEAVKLSQDDILRFQALETRLKAVEDEKAILQGAVTEMKDRNDNLSGKVQKFQKAAEVAEVEKFCAELERDYDLTPVALETFRPLLNQEDGAVKLSEDSEPVTAAYATRHTIQGLLSLAKEDRLFVPTGAGVPSGKQEEIELTPEQQQKAGILKYWKNDAGKELRTYGEAFSMATKDPALADLFNPMRQLSKGGE